ncbi:MAG TPA: hypothetical protein EYM84_10470 [Flavobacteriales bacterium]|nr:hypothetical protein [Flavobacteriales bacterium]HIN40684.1 hypothetical protein [Flavobacteriales bacterium]
MSKIKSILDALNTQKAGDKTSVEEIISINDLRDKHEEGPLNDEEKSALLNYDNYRIRNLNSATDEEDFHSKYRLLQVLANLSPYKEFLHDKYKVLRTS